MILAKIEQLLQSAIGLDASSLGRPAVCGAVERRMTVLGVGDMEDYYGRLTTATDELNELIETVVIPETWFFRDRKPFAALEHHVREKRDRGAMPTSFRALSLPCSTGEEPYSIAIALLEAGVAAQEIRVDARDVSRTALDYARRANYGSHSFRGHQDPAIMERYFIRDETRYLVREQVRQLVHFDRANIIDDALAAARQRYDVIFCRNLLIYLDERFRHRAFGTLHRLLNDDGLLFLGHAEGGTAPPELFLTAGRSTAYAFTKTGEDEEAPHSPAPAPNRRTAPARPAAPARVARARPTQTGAGPRPSPPPQPKPAPEDELELARQLADMGRLAEAREICARYLDDRGRRAQAYFLHALIDNASGETRQAEQYLRKAIYLDPDHYEALIHLSLLLAQQGDHSGAALLRRRAEKASAQCAL
ncbi:MAG: hypothetical protein GWO16_03830 [Gammaproteobacteria bacterium]|nr:hypothetical protein [Gammaproteobacteria bacterium]NIR28837.1 hypothetical protein [Gammaproteobacteria bacterium]NIR97218.1 hypothetical protein [Gammaproteobacteria bacterium]NIT62929.1 hypothetical protein [Gammaproteobacteria bacterium]NIV19899.1 hypothetical protein [Gammaproteobacteria bacterium]